jgi:microcin C transport system substrate-binding protein
MRLSGPAGHLLPALFAALCLQAASVQPAAADETQWQVGAALLGKPKYPPDFKHFDYVNPNAPKGGLLKAGASGSFDTLNVSAVLKGTPATGMGSVYETLMAASMDEPYSHYPLLADKFKAADDYSWVIYHVDPRARWHDGKPVTAEDVVWSFEAETAINPRLKAYYSHVASVKITGDNEVTFTFDQPGNRELPYIVGELTILPKHWWTGTRPDGRPRNIAESSLEIPLGSGPYKVKSVEPGANIVFERVKDYWGQSIPTQIGSDNFDEMRFDYYRDENVLLEAFKGGQYDYRAENSSKRWATQYQYQAVKDGRVLLETFDIKSVGGMQSFTPNLRREKFQDIRVRQALDLAFNFEELNRTITYGQYSRTESFFAPLDLAAKGLPTPAELEILEPLRDKVPPEVFTTEYKSPVNGDPLKVRDNLRKALDLLKAAGYELSGGKLVNARTKEPFKVELLLDSPTFEPHALSFVESLKKIGIEMTINTVDDTQYTERVRSFDFDMLIDTIGQSNSPGNEQYDFFSTKAADTRGSNNLAGIKNAAVDAIIPKIVYAKDRDALIAACRALDRVLMWNHFVIPQWHYGKLRLARWDRFSHPDTLPEYGASGFPTIWWFDPAKSAKVGGRT